MRYFFIFCSRAGRIARYAINIFLFEENARIRSSLWLLCPLVIIVVFRFVPLLSLLHYIVYKNANRSVHAINGCSLVFTHYNDVKMGAIASQITSLNGLFRRRSKKTSKIPVTGLCTGNSPGTRKMFPFYDVIMLFWHLLAFRIKLCRSTELIWYNTINDNTPRHVTECSVVHYSLQTHISCAIISLAWSNVFKALRDTAMLATTRIGAFHNTTTFCIKISASV